MQTQNSGTIKYSGPLESLLLSANCLELAEITTAHLEAWASGEGATPLQFSRLLSLWTGGQDPSPELLQLASEIAWPKEKARLLTFLNGNALPSPELDTWLESQAWK